MRHNARKSMYVLVCVCVCKMGGREGGGKEGREKGTYTCGEQGGSSICRAEASQSWSLLKYPKELLNIPPLQDKTSRVFINLSANPTLTSWA